MWSDRLTARLRRLYGPVPPDSSPPVALERALLAEHARLHPGPAPARAWAGVRWAAAGLAGALGLAAACQVPVDYEREFGVSVACDLSAGTWPEGQIERAAHDLAVALGGAAAAIRVEARGDGTRRFRIDLWGADLDEAALLAELRRAAPGLPEDACTPIPLAGTVHGTLGGRLGYGLLDLDLDHADAEEARREILAELERRGLEGDAEVEIRDHGDGKREVQIRIEAFHDGDGPLPPLPP